MILFISFISYQILATGEKFFTPSTGYPVNSLFAISLISSDDIWHCVECAFYAISKILFLRFSDKHQWKSHADCGHNFARSNGNDRGAGTTNGKPERSSFTGRKYCHGDYYRKSLYSLA